MLINIDNKLEIWFNYEKADVAELADALDLGSNVPRRVGSSPTIRTKNFFTRWIENEFKGYDGFGWVVDETAGSRK